MTAQSLIINSPYETPSQHWSQDANGKIAQIAEGRRPAAYEMYDTRNNTRRVELLDTVNRIRQRVDDWREAGWPGVTMVTRALLEHWDARGEWVAEARRWEGGPRQYPFYFCQLEAIETLIWWLEAPADHRQGVFLPGDGGSWERICSKMATGSGKTTVMGLIATWQTLNALQYPKDSRFSYAIFVVTPGLTVKSRLQVLLPGDEKNVYDEFAMCPTEAMRQRLNQMEIRVENWHTLMPLKEPARSVVKKGKESDEAFTRRVLGRLAGFKDLIVFNDEAHHAYRQRAEVKVGRKEAEALGIDLEEATRWIEGLDRIHKTRRIRRCFDLSATPFAPTGKTNTEAGLYEWIVSDFGLNDAIEAGLVKTPRVVIRDDALANAKSYASKLYHLYREDEVRDDLNRKADSTAPLPRLVQNAYALLTYDWRETQKAWQAEGHTIPPVMLTVFNRTETAARIERFFNEGDCIIEGTQVPEHTLRVDSRVLEKAERGEKVTKDKEYAARLEQIIKAAGLPVDKQNELLALKQEEQLRALVDTVGKRGRPGQQLQNVVSVAMLSEGWDAANVTHIMGLRAFTSQLLCEQVIGRGLRRVAHDMDEHGYFLPEFVNVFGVPLSIFQEVGEGGETPPVPKASVRIEVEPGRNGYEIRWPNVVRIESVLKPELRVDWSAVEPLALDPNVTPINAEIAPSLTGIVNLAQASAIDLESAAQDFRLQNLIFRATRKLYRELDTGFEGDTQYLAIQLIRLVEQFLASDKLTIPARWYAEPARRRLLIGLNIDAVVTHVSRYIRQRNTTRLEPLFDEQLPIGSTSAMRPWLTTKPCEPTSRSQISHAVHDSTWEKAVVAVCETSDDIAAWAKNDHLDFVVRYLWEGSSRRFIPDFLIKLTNGRTLVLEVKGQDSDRNRVKRAAMAEWVEAINQAGGFGQWCFDTVFDPARTRDVIARHSQARSVSLSPSTQEIAGSVVGE